VSFTIQVTRTRINVNGCHWNTVHADSCLLEPVNGHSYSYSCLCEHGLR